MTPNLDAIRHPKGRRTHGAYRSSEEAIRAGQNLLYILNGMPLGFRMTIIYRMGFFVLVSYPTTGCSR